MACVTLHIVSRLQHGEGEGGKEKVMNSKPLILDSTNGRTHTAKLDAIQSNKAKGMNEKIFCPCIRLLVNGLSTSPRLRIIAMTMVTKYGNDYQ